MPDIIQADTALLRAFADRLDPAPVVAVRAAAAEIRAVVTDCGDPLPGCLLFTRAVRQLADQVAAFGSKTEQDIHAYAAAARDSAAIYTAADASWPTAEEG